MVAEDPALLQRPAMNGVSAIALSSVVTRVRDVYHPEVRTQTTHLLRELPRALGATAWSYGGVPLWETVVTDFQWRFLDSVFQAADIAADLLDATRPDSVAITAPSSYVARALAVVAHARGIPATFLDDTPAATRRRAAARLLPVLGHVRDCLRAATGGSGRRGGPAPVVLLNHVLRNFQVVEAALRSVRDQLGRDRLLVVETGGTASYVERNGFRSRAFMSYASPLDMRALASIGGIVTQLMSGAWTEAVADARLEWDHVPLHCLAFDEIAYALPRLLGSAAREIATAHRMLRAERPALVMMTEDRSSFTRAVAFASKTMDVPTLLVQWGCIAPNAAWLPKVATDVAAVEGDAAAEVLRASEGGDALRVCVTGQPRYDEIASQAAAASKADICRAADLDPSRPIVLLACHPIREASAAMKRNFVEERYLTDEVAAVIDAVRAHPGVQLVIKPHPNEGSVAHRDLVEHAANADVRLLTRTESAYPYLFACDVVVTRRSSLGLEGLLLGKTLIVVNLCGTPDGIPFVDHGVAIGAYSTPEVVTALAAAVFDAASRARLAASRPRFLRRYVGHFAESPTERLTELTLSIARQRTSSVPAPVMALQP